ncbi:MAG: carboxypeptidase-like regulatory domain-containing protein [Bacteroidota bacterium]|nr:carboxypeptidase-like regulatory domain-containing protein [Bacteroidota bacterium]
MKRFLIIFAAFLFLLHLNACKEDEINIIEGQIINYPENEALENVNILCEVKVIQQASYNNSWETIGETKTESDGSFRFEFESLRAQEYRVSLSRDGYRNKTLNFLPKDYSDTYNIQETLVKSARLEIHIKNMIFPNSNSDEIKIRVSDIPEECTDCTIAEFKTLTGASIDTTLIYQVAGDDEVFIEYTINKDGSEYFQSTKYMEANTVNTKNITF